MLHCQLIKTENDVVVSHIVTHDQKEEKRSKKSTKSPTSSLNLFWMIFYFFVLIRERNINIPVNKTLCCLLLLVQQTPVWVIENSKIWKFILDSHQQPAAKGSCQNTTHLGSVCSRNCVLSSGITDARARYTHVCAGLCSPQIIIIIYPGAWNFSGWKIFRFPLPLRSRSENGNWTHFCLQTSNAVELHFFVVSKFSNNKRTNAFVQTSAQCTKRKSWRAVGKNALNFPSNKNYSKWRREAKNKLKWKETYSCVWHHNVAGAVVAFLRNFVQPILWLWIVCECFNHFGWCAALHLHQKFSFLQIKHEVSVNFPFFCFLSLD